MKRLFGLVVCLTGICFAEGTTTLSLELSGVTYYGSARNSRENLAPSTNDSVWRITSVVSSPLAVKTGYSEAYGVNSSELLPFTVSGITNAVFK